MGDFNINLLNNQSKEIQRYIDNMIDKDLQQIINLPTRVKKESTTLIDHIYIYK